MSTHSPPPDASVPAWRLALLYAASDGVPGHSLRVALVVGTVLCLVNQGDALFGDGAVNWAKAGLTYVVPYMVSTSGAVPFRLGLRGRTHPNPCPRLVQGSTAPHAAGRELCGGSVPRSSPTMPRRVGVQTDGRSPDHRIIQIQQSSLCSAAGRLIWHRATVQCCPFMDRSEKARPSGSGGTRTRCEAVGQRTPTPAQCEATRSGQTEFMVCEQPTSAWLRRP